MSCPVDCYIKDDFLDCLTEKRVMMSLSEIDKKEESMIGTGGRGAKIMSLFQDELSLGYGCLGTRAGDRDL